MYLKKLTFFELGDPANFAVRKKSLKIIEVIENFSFKEMNFLV